MLQHSRFCGTGYKGLEDHLEALHTAPKSAYISLVIGNLNSTFVSPAAFAFKNALSTGSRGLSWRGSFPIKLANRHRQVRYNVRSTCPGDETPWL